MSAQPPPSLLILGAGGHGRVVAEAARAQGGWSQLRATDRDPAKCVGQLLPGIALQAIEPAQDQGGMIHVAIGDASAREREVRAARLPLAMVIHPRACLSPSALLEDGCFLAAQSVVASGANLGRCVIVNHGAVVDHDVEVGEFSHIAPLVALSGRVRIGRRVLVGAGAQVLPGVRVADDVIIGAGAVVNQDIVGPGVYAGVPARRVR